MTSIRKAALACVASALLALPFSAAAQGPRNQDTFFTFSQSVELPNKTLPAGRYLFQLADSPSNRHIVKVMSEDRKEIHATLMAIPFYSNDRPSDEPQVRFMETPASGTNGADSTTAAAGTNAIKIWFYPGNSVGHEFIYPRSQAMRIASRTGSSVLTTKTDAEIEASVADADLTRVDRSGADSAVSLEARTETTPAATAQPEASASASAQTQPQTSETPRPMTAPADTQTTPQTDARTATPTDTTAQSTTAQTTPDRSAAPMRDRDTDTARTDLPNTAGFLPLLAVIGIGSLVGSRWLRRSRRV
jgi:hypothetical protein